MLTVTTILLVIALLLFFSAAIGRPVTAPIGLGWFGAFFVTLVLLLERFSH